jgi:hypothetical protein
MEEAQVVPYVCLREHCPFGAILNGNSFSYRCGNQLSFDGLGWGRTYKVDQKACTGCMICYNNIICGELSMKAYIKPRIGARFRVVRVRRVTVPSIRLPENVSMEFWGRNLSGIIHEKMSLQIDQGSLPGSPAELPVDIDLVKKGIAFIGALHITVLAGKGTIIGYPWIKGRHPPEKVVLNLDDITGASGMSSYMGSFKVLNCLEVDYQLDRIRCH